MKSTITTALAVITLTIIPLQSAFGATIFVPTDQATIQGAINAAGTGDLVSVAPGTYNEILSISSKVITIQSEGGAESTVLDANRWGSGVTFDGLSGTSSLIGFTIRNGYTQLGGGINIINWATPSIDNCTVTQNTSEYSGGGINISAGCSATITNCTVTYNAGDNGGGIFCMDGTDPVIRNCRIAWNRTTYIYGGHGGGIYIRNGSTAIVDNCLITDNTATGYGGGAWSYLQESAPTFTNCTFVDNSSEDGGGGLAAYRTGTIGPIVTNCIFWRNASIQGPQIWVGSSPSQCTFSYCTVQGGQPGIYVAAGCSVNWLAGNSSSDPQFVEKGDFELADGSPCIDAGDPTASRNDVCFPPSKGTARNDMGVYGGPGACLGLGPEEPSLVELIAFDGEFLTPDVRLAWETASEIDNEGFHLWRSEVGKEDSTRITERLIASEGGPTWGGRYEFVDKGVAEGKVYRYELEAIDLYGESTFHGPIDVSTGELTCFIGLVL